MSIMFWQDVASSMGLDRKRDPIEELNKLRKSDGLLPVTVDTYDAPHPSTILYERPLGYSYTYTLKPKWVNLKHTNPYQAPFDMRLAHVKMLAKEMCERFGIDPSEL